MKELDAKIFKINKKILIIAVVCLIIAAIATFLIFFIINANNERIKSEERARLVKEYFDEKISSYEIENATSTADVVFLGDSLTDGCDLKKYYPEFTTFNRGIGGDTSYGLLDRLKISAYDARPKVIVLLIGGNDVLGGKSLESIYLNYDKIIQGIKENLPETKIVWCSLTAMGNQWAKHNDSAVICNQKIKLLANKYGCRYVDLFTPLCDVETGEIFPEYTAEGVHFTDQGYKVVSAEIKKALNEIFN